MSVPSVTLTGSALTGVNSPTRLRAFGVNPDSLPVHVKLGRVAPKARPQVLRLASYLSTNLASTPPPDAVNYADKAMASIARMYLNDQYGDCVIAGKAHHVGVWSGNDTDSGGVALGTDQEIYNQYQQICGPGDNGCIITNVLDVMKTRGLILNGRAHKIDGYVAVDWTNKVEVQVAIYLFGAITLGINLPQAWTNSAIWDTTNTQIVGGHDVAVVGYNSQGVQISSWGRVYTITWRAFLSTQWLSEAYALLGPDWYNADKISPTGFDATKLIADLQKIGGGGLPDITPPVPVVPPPPVVPPSPPVPPPSPPTPTPTPSLVPYTVTGKVSGLFGGTFTGTAIPQPPHFHAECQGESAQIAFPTIDPALIEKIVQNINKLLPIIMADIKAGKTWQQILTDCALALILGKV